MDDQHNASSFTSPQRIFNRPPRILRKLPDEEVELPPPPQLPPAQRPRLASVILPLMSAGLYLVVALLRGNSNGGGMLLTLPMVGLSLLMAGMGIYTYFDQRSQQKAAREAAQAAFTIAFNTIDIRLSELWSKQRQLRHENDPGIALLLQIVERAEPRLWERRPEDPDFLALRIGIGEYPSTVKIKKPSSSATNEFTLQLHDLAARYATVRDVPRTLLLPRAGSLGIAGPAIEAQAMARALIWQIAVHHSPAEVRIAAFWHSRHDAEWSWLRHLPHTRSLIGEERYRLLANIDYTNDPEDQRKDYLQEVLQEIDREIRQRLDLVSQPVSQERPLHLPYLVVVVDSYEECGAALGPIQTILKSGSAIGASAMCLVRHMREVPGDCGAYLDLQANPMLLAIAGINGGRIFFQPDQIDSEKSRRMALAMSNIQLGDVRAVQNLPRTVNLLDLLGIADPRSYDCRRYWALQPPNDDTHPSGLFPVPIGSSGPDMPLMLDLNEKKQGVHGMIAGTTGSGKSELLTTLLLGLAILHHPDRLNFMLIDFKGGATFRDLARLPHTAGFITDLSGSQAQRALIAINSELDRRKQTFGAHGVPNIKGYRNLLPPPSPIPNLLIAIDEFDEMARDYPHIVEELIRVAKQGRSLGVHLLFATQQPSNSAIKAGLRANLTYWIALRVIDPEDSKLMIHSKEAAAIPNSTPGRAYLRVDNEVVAFQSAIATLPYRSPEQKADDIYLIPDATGRLISPQQRRKKIEGLQTQDTQEEHGSVSTLSPAQNMPPATTPSASAKVSIQGRPARRLTDADVIMSTMEQSLGSGYAAEKYPIWRPPLTSTQLLSDVVAVGQRREGLRLLDIPLGLLDDPQNASQEPLILSLAERGSILVVGSSSSGKTSLLRSCVLALSATHSPAEVAFYIIDSTGQGLGFRADQGTNKEPAAPALPHIGDVLRTTDYTKIDRLLSVLEDEIRDRQQHFLQIGVESWVAYRQSRPESSMPALVVMIDGLVEFAEQNPDPIKQISRLIRGAKAFGIHFILTADRLSSAIPSDLKNSIATKLVLRLSSENDSLDLLNKPFAYALHPRDHGRGYLPAAPYPKEFQIGFPTLRPRAEIERMLTQEAAPLDPDGEKRLLDLSSLKMIDVELPASVALINHYWRQHYHGPTTRSLELLPAHIEVKPEVWQVVGQTNGARASLNVEIATDNRTLQPLALDLATTPHLLICGGPRTGKSNVLRAILAGLALRYRPEQVVFYLVDYRMRVLRPFQTLPHTRCFAADKDELVAMIDELDRLFKDRKAAIMELHPVDAQIVLAISNWDMLDADARNLDRLARWMVQAQELGIHLLITSSDFSQAASSSLLKIVRMERSSVILGNADVSPTSLGLSKIPKLPPTMDAVPGRGFIVEGGRERLVQFWHVPDALLDRLPFLSCPDRLPSLSGQAQHDGTVPGYPG